MYLTAHRVRRVGVNKTNVGIDAFLYEHEEEELPDDLRQDQRIVDQIVNLNPGKLIAESVDIEPGGNSVLSFVDIVGSESLDQRRIQDFLDQLEREVTDVHSHITRSAQDIAVRFGITYELQGHELGEFKALTKRAMRLFVSREPPRWRSEQPWIEIHHDVSDHQETFSLTQKTAEKLRQMHGGNWVSSRVSIDRHTKLNFEYIHGDLMQHVVPILTALTLEQVAAQGGLILEDTSSGEKIKWPELSEL